MKQLTFVQAMMSDARPQTRVAKRLLRNCATDFTTKKFLSFFGTTILKICGDYYPRGEAHKCVSARPVTESKVQKKQQRNCSCEAKQDSSRHKFG